ncbi:MAG TPA: hypothetical protein DCY80_02060 [Solibacterales bacterium]|nr:hypothetical protein [Bryobacterales bacterium]
MLAAEPLFMRWILLFALLLTAGSCSRPSGPLDFNALRGEFIYGTLALSPVSATAAGYHRHQDRNLDEQLDDLSAAGLDRQRRYWRDWQKRFAQIDQQTLDAEDRADLSLMQNQVESALLELDEIRSWQHNPTLYVELLGHALFTPFSIEYAPAPDRWRHIIARLQAAPALLAAARANLNGVPGVWARVAREENEGNIRLAGSTLRDAVPQDLRPAFDQAVEPALAAMHEFAQFLDQLPDAGPDSWRLGPEKYEKKFKLAMGGTRTVEQSLQEAEQDLRAFRKRMFDIALPLHNRYFPNERPRVDLNLIVGRVLDRIAENRPTRASYFADARKTLDETRAFLNANPDQLLTPPTRDNLELIETPEFMRGIYGVGGFSTAPALQPELGAFYWLTPIPDAWSEERAQSKLREYNDYALRILTIHEAIPGHYVQFEYANQIQPESRRLLRALFGNGVYIEGWAMYSTEAMLDAGYLNGSPELRLTFLKQMLRAIANAILDIRLHTKSMSREDAMALMLTQTFQEQEEAAAKWQRAQLSSCQLPTYYAGYREFLNLRSELEKQPGFSRRDFHERALHAGALPMRTLAELLGVNSPTP